MDINFIIKMAHIAVDKIENDNATNHSSKFDKFNGIAELATTMIWDEMDNGNMAWSDGLRSIDAISDLCFKPSPTDNYI